MPSWRIITVPALTALPFAIAGLLGARHVPSTLPPCLEAVESLDFQRSPIDGVWMRQIEINNCGGAPVALDAVAIDDVGHAAGFSVVGPTTARIDVNTPLTLTVGFTPGQIGAHSGALRIGVDGRALLRVDLLGEGIRPAAMPGCAAELPGGFVVRDACDDRSARFSTEAEPRGARGAERDAAVTDAHPPAT